MGDEHDATLSFHADDPRVRRLNDRPTNRRGRATSSTGCRPSGAPRTTPPSPTPSSGRTSSASPASSTRRCARTTRTRATASTPSSSRARGTSRGAASSAGVAHAFFLPRTPAEARGVVAKLAARARARRVRRLPELRRPRARTRRPRSVPRARTSSWTTARSCRMALLAKPETAARTHPPEGAAGRSTTGSAPSRASAARASARAPRPALRSGEPRARRRRARSSPRARSITRCLPSRRRVAGRRRPRSDSSAFVAGPLATYAGDRNDPSRDATSGLSPYLHFGMISARRVGARGARLGERESRSRRSSSSSSCDVRSPSTSPRTRPDHAHWSALPAWARATLAGARGRRALRRPVARRPRGGPDRPTRSGTRR